MGYKTRQGKVRRQSAKDRPRSGFSRWVLPATVAVAVVLAIAVIVQPPPPAPGNVPVGSIVRVVGETGILPAVGHQIYPGDRLSTGAGQGLSLLLGNAESLRIDEQSSLMVHTKDEFRLTRGRVYADTGDFMYRDHGLVIETSMGSVTDVGTQFSVAAEDDLIGVAVRVGRVDVSKDAELLVVVAGERVRIHRDGGATFETLASHDSYWDWANSLAPEFDIENKSLLDFLRWTARETGRELLFESDELRLSAMRIELHGTVSDFGPLAVESILATTTLKYRIEADKIVIER